MKLSVAHKDLTLSIEDNLTTDSEGKVALGRLERVKILKSEVRQKGDIFAETRSWQLDNLQRVQYPSVIHLCEGEQLSLKYFGPLERSKISFLSYLPSESGNSIIENLFDVLMLEKETIRSPSLSSGSYLLELFDEEKRILITVHKGRRHKYICLFFYMYKWYIERVVNIFE